MWFRNRKAPDMTGPADTSPTSETFVEKVEDDVKSFVGKTESVVKTVEDDLNAPATKADIKAVADKLDGIIESVSGALSAFEAMGSNPILKSLFKTIGK